MKALATYQVDEEDVCTIYNFNRKESSKVNVDIAGRSIEMIVDTGASITVISEDVYVYKAELAHIKLQKSTVKLQSCCGKLLKVQGEATVSVRYGEQEFCDKLVVVDAPGKPAVLWRIWLTKIFLDWNTLFGIQYEGHLDAVWEFPNVFKEGMGKFREFKAKIELSPDAKPLFYKPRPVPFALQERVCEEIDRLVSEDILQPVEQSAWVSLIVIVCKADGGIRLCGDYKVTIHLYLDHGQYPTPNAEDLFATLAGGKRFTRLDLRQAYQQMEVDIDSQQYLTINTIKGFCTFTRLPFGIKTASIFQKAMDCILSGLPGVCCFHDDILFSGNSDKEHDDCTRKVLNRLDQAGVRLRSDKCEFNKLEVQYLEHIVDQRGLRPTQEKIRAIKEAPTPTNVSELKSFLGLLYYYNRFLPNLCDTLKPLHLLLQKGKQWKWTHKEEEAFESAKASS